MPELEIRIYGSRVIVSSGYRDLLIMNFDEKVSSDVLFYQLIGYIMRALEEMKKNEQILIEFSKVREYA